MGASDQPLSNIQVGEFDVLDSGVVTSPGNRPITIQVTDNIELEFIFDFEGDSEPSYSIDTVSDEKLVVILENFKAGVVMGGTTPPIGLLEPIVIGDLVGRELLLLFRVSSTQGNDGTAHSTLYYNFYLGEPLEGENDGSE
ncbi:hypothetical protein EGO51_10720 [Haloarcula hispanica]|uniref:Uncharacterized protein n=1 Tax=Haloarcula hispanica TaxID=51589 RepID=A0A5J5LL84_HALHI|nr:hypothetical protein [Haloarcula hispanica]KAA9410255.1 hypothetical protein EGO51_10720 [Haloarcula hispanica]